VGNELLTERHAAQIAGVLGCRDRMLIFGYPKFAEPFRNRIRENAEKMAAEAGIEIEFIRKRNFRKEDRVKEIIAERGEHAGLVCIFPAMEPCSTYKPCG
jgi:hypothetical protein